MADRITELLEPAVAGLGYELLYVEMVRAKGVTLRLYIDHPDGVGLEDCEAVSRQVGAVLEVEDPIASEYNLEVSSPGWDRPLVKPEHFQRFAGEKARVMMAVAQQGRRKFTGEIISADEQAVQLQIDGENVALNFADMDRARLVPGD